MTIGKLIKKVLSLILFLVIVISVVNISTINSSAEEAPATLKVHYFNIGHGDSEFIELPNGQCMLIDAGLAEYGDRIVDYIENLGYSKIDYLVASHNHSDHIGGIPRVIEALEIGGYYKSKYISNTSAVKSVDKAIKKYNELHEEPIEVTEVEPEYKFFDETVEDKALSCVVLGPITLDVDGIINNTSLVMKLKFGNKTYLFTGDAEDKEEYSLVRAGVDLKSDVLKVGHHGYATGTTQDFIDAINPTYAVIVGESETSRTEARNILMTRLAKANILVYSTLKTGNVISTCDGNNITFNRDTYYNISIESSDMFLSYSSATYSGGHKKPSVIIKYGTYVLTPNKDYTVSYKNNVNSGTASVIATGIGKYTKTVTKTFKIKRKSVSGFSCKTISNIEYSGRNNYPQITVYHSGKTLKSGTDYYTTYYNNKSIGAATVRVTGKNNYTGSATVTFNIIPNKLSISSIYKQKTKLKKSKEKKLKTANFVVKINKVKSVSGYQFKYSTSENGTYKTITSTKKNYCTAKNFKKYKKYYVKVRAYKYASGKTIYGKYSDIKHIKLK